jgi:hypothetical protein
MKKPDWLIRHKWLTGVGTVFVAGTIALLIYQPSWTGFGPDSTKNTERDSTGKVIKTVEVEQSGKTLWDWLGVLGVPFSLAVLGIWFQQREQKRAGEQAKLDKEIAEANQREEALQAYFDRLSTLLVDQNLIAIAAKVKRADEAKEQPDLVIEEQRELLDAAVDVIRARTLSILRQFGEDGERKGSVIRFLTESEVISNLNLSLQDADLRYANLGNVKFQPGYLKGANPQTIGQGTNLQGADFRYANLESADLRGANLQKADFRLVPIASALTSKVPISKMPTSPTQFSLTLMFSRSISMVASSTRPIS